MKKLIILTLLVTTGLFGCNSTNAPVYLSDVIEIDSTELGDLLMRVKSFCYQDAQTGCHQVLVMRLTL